MISTSCVLRIYCFSVSHAPLRLRFSRFDLAMASDRAAHTIVRRSWASATDRARAIGLPKRHSQVLIWNSLLPLVLRAAFGAPSFLSPALACFAENAGHVCCTVFILLRCRKHGIRGTRHRMFSTGTTYEAGHTKQYRPSLAGQSPCQSRPDPPGNTDAAARKQHNPVKNIMSTWRQDNVLLMSPSLCTQYIMLTQC